MSWVARVVVAVVGDGSLTGGMTWEALNNIAVQPELRLVIVVLPRVQTDSPAQPLPWRCVTFFEQF